MAPSSFKKIGAAVAYAAVVKAATESYQLSEEYTADNFFDKFDFFVSTYTSDDSYDSTHGFVQYRSQADAESLGLISTSSGQIYIGPDYNNTYDVNGKGRNSVKITSKSTYNQGLMIAKFSHMPQQACGAWPAFWSYGNPWLTKGEIDMYEGWDLMGYNRMAMHTNETIAGDCELSTSGIKGTILTQACNNDDADTGCSVEDSTGVWGSSTGATFALEWTDSAIKIWSWVTSDVPSDITAGTPDPSSSAWGNPTLLIEQSNCDLSKAFADQQLVFDIDFCGDAAGSSSNWDASCSSYASTCTTYVAENPSAFANTYFMIEGIQFYELGSSTASVSASVSLGLAASTEAASTEAASTTTSTSAGLLAGTGTLLDATIGATAASTEAAAAAAITSTSSYSHSTGYVYSTSVATDETGSETTVVLTVDTTICPVTAAEASASSALARESSSLAEAQATPTPEASVVASHLPASPASGAASHSHYTTSTIFSTSSAAITSCHPTASACRIGDVTTVVVAVSTTICPVTAAEASESAAIASKLRASNSTGVVIPASGKATPAGLPPHAPSSATHAHSTSYLTIKSTYTTSLAVASSTSKASTSTASATTEVVSGTSTSGDLETATASPTSVTLAWLSTTASQAAATTGSSSNGTATSTGASSATKSSSCEGVDCIVVSSSGSKNGIIGASGLALAAVAGVAFLL